MEDFCELVSNLPEDRRRLVEQMALHLLEAEAQINVVNGSEEAVSTDEMAPPLAQLHERINELAAANGQAESPRESRTFVVLTFEQLNKFLAVDKS